MIAGHYSAAVISKKYRSCLGTFLLVAVRHETVAFCWLFLAPQQKATGTLLMRFVIAALSVCVVMMLNLNSLSEHGKNPRDNTRNGNEMSFSDRAADLDIPWPVAASQTLISGAAASAIPAEEQQAVPTDPNDDETVEPSKRDFCHALREAAESSDIPVAFFARLLWQESRFKSNEVSHAGAKGVAQFMPETAAEVGLDDPFDPFKALPASAKLLQKLRRDFGNLGLAAAAYNAGSGRIQKWLSRQSSLPKETKDYVRIITGSAATEWTDESKTVALRLELPRGAPCEGVGGLSKSAEVATMPVALAPSISNAVRKAEAEAQRFAAAKSEAAAKRAALQERKKLAKDASPRRSRMASAKTAAPQRRTKTAEQSGRVRLASAAGR
jgi:hypothetical protein